MTIPMSCPYCYKELEFDSAEVGKEVECPFCHRAIFVEGAEPPEEESTCVSGNSKEYKVVTQRDKAISLLAPAGRIDPKQFEDALNLHAKHGWRVVGCVNTTSFSERNEIVAIMERDRPKREV